MSFRLISNNILTLDTRKSSETFGINNGFNFAGVMDMNRLYFNRVYLCKGTYDNINIVIDSATNTDGVIGAIYERGNTSSGSKVIKIPNSEFGSFKTSSDNNPIFTDNNIYQSTNISLTIDCSKVYLVCFYDPTGTMNPASIFANYNNAVANFSYPTTGIVVDGKLPEEFSFDSTSDVPINPFYINLC